MEEARAVLKRYELSGVNKTGREVGSGSFSRVVEVEYDGMKYAAKHMDEELYRHRGTPGERGDREKNAMKRMQRFLDECLLHNELRHPNIVKCIGVYCTDSMLLPGLVMELLPIDLEGYMEEHGVLGTEMACSILRDVAAGLQYLHDRPQPVVHRDLLANNVLLTEDPLCAKLCDFTTARVLTPAVRSREMSPCPGAFVAMPPEALVERPHYGTEIDIFSYGVLALSVCTGEWPGDLLSPTKEDSGTLVCRSEAERRWSYLFKMGPNDPMRNLTIDCLSNDPAHRPTATQILLQLQEVISGYQMSKQLFDEAMKYGYVEAGLIVLLLIGTTGADTMDVKHHLLGLPPPSLHQSTGEVNCAVSTLQAIVSDSNEMVWSAATVDRLKRMISEALEARPQESQEKIVPSLRPLNKSVLVGEPRASKGDVAQQCHHSSERVSPGIASKPPLEEALPNVLPHGQILEEDLITSPSGSRKLFTVDWVCLVDGSEQPSFRDILSLFGCAPTAVTFVVDLDKQLKEKPTLEWYGDNRKQCDSSYCSLLTNEEIFRRNIQGICTCQYLGPQVFVVDTHKDCKRTCIESRKEKNSTLLNIAGSEELIFQVNAKEPTEEDRKVAEKFRRTVVSKGSTQIRIEIPLPWYVLEQYIRQLTAKVHRKVLRTSECETEAKKLHMTAEACEEALVFLDKINRVFYRPHYLKGLVFCSAQVWLDKIAELSELMDRLQGRPETSGGGHFPDLSIFCDKERTKFRNYGIVTVSILKKFPRHYVDGLFTTNELLKLLTAFLVMAPLSESSHEYIMPCLLQGLSPRELDNCRRLSSSPAAPLLILFSCNCVPAGVFVILTAYLQNLPDWSLSFSSSGNPCCLHRNCVELCLPSSLGGKVTLIDSLKYIEVHVHGVSDGAFEKTCPQIAAEILRGVKGAACRLHYGTLELKTAFPCPSPSSACLGRHPATVIDNELVCSVSRRKTGEVQDQHRLWLLSLEVKKESSSFDFDKTPQIHELHYLSNEACNITIRIVEEIQSDWRELSNLLRLPQRTIRDLEDELSDKACRGVFEKWLSGEGRGLRNWHTVIEVLRAMNQNTVADKIVLM